jgi:hypothetical protein
MCNELPVVEKDKSMAEAYLGPSMVGPSASNVSAPAQRRDAEGVAH